MSVVALIDDGSARILRLAESGLVETARYAGRPWFVDAVRMGALVVCISADRQSLQVCGVGPTAVI
jgi:hypothetical protein